MSMENRSLKVSSKTGVSSKRVVSKKNIDRPAWYIDPAHVRPLVSQSWSTEERMMILKLRDKNIPVSDIIDIFSPVHGIVKATLIYNQIRMAKASIEGRCFQCRRKLTTRELESKVTSDSGLHLCYRCRKANRTYKKDLRDHALKSGLCGVCRKRKVISGKTTCIKCTSESHRRRYLKGLCGTCGRRPIDSTSHSLCTHCLEKNRVRSKYYRIKKGSS